MFLPFNVGVFGFADVGRVHVEGNILNPGTALSVEIGDGQGISSVRLRTGMIF